MGRPSSLTAELAARIAAAFGRGLMRDEVAAELGLEPRTLYRWIAAGRAGDGSGLEVIVARSAEIELLTLRRRRQAAGRMRGRGRRE